MYVWFLATQKVLVLTEKGVKKSILSFLNFMKVLLHGFKITRFHLSLFYDD